ncbi:MAG: sulfur carrier protein ThiS [Spirochaetota bacterium]
MKLYINGKEENIERENLSVVELLTLKEVKMPDMVSVQLNGNILKRNNFNSTYVKENDRVEFLYFMGGGCDGADY